MEKHLTSLGEMRTEARCCLFARHLVHHFRKPIDVLDQHGAALALDDAEPR